MDTPLTSRLGWNELRSGPRQKNVSGTSPRNYRLATLKWYSSTGTDSRTPPPSAPRGGIHRWAKRWWEGRLESRIVGSIGGEGNIDRRSSIDRGKAQ